jgi:GTP-binding protein EngB required for normal cell division
MSPEELEQSENDLVAQREQDKRRREEAADKITRGPNKMSISLIVGLPNVGKSTLINQLIGRGTASVASVPGWTRGQQIYKLNTLNPADSLSRSFRHFRWSTVLIGSYFLIQRKSTIR